VVKATKELEQLWWNYRKSGDRRIRNELVERYLPLVHDISDKIRSRLPRCVEVDDLRSAGIFGLIAAIEAYDADRGTKFETYCSLRVRGSILDELRSLDWVPRLIRSKAQRLQSTHRELETDLGRRPRDDEMAERLGLTLGEFHTLVREAAATNVVSLNKRWNDSEERGNPKRLDDLADQTEMDPVESLEQKEVGELVHRDLSRKDKLILFLYYYDGLTMREIGRLLNLSESRVCQLHARILDRLRERLDRLKPDLLA
jgi:RNA polymerase sigma factor for flagellar operon FliA